MVECGDLDAGQLFVHVALCERALEFLENVISYNKNSDECSFKINKNSDDNPWQITFIPTNKEDIPLKERVLRANKLSCQIGLPIQETITIHVDGIMDIINQCANEPLWNVQDLL